MDTRERLTLPNRRPAAGPSMQHPQPPPPDPINTRQFDESRILTFRFTGSPGAGESVRFGPFEIYTAPDGIARAELRHLSVNGEPEGVFLSRVAWQLNIYGGGTQDFLPRSINNVPNLTPAGPDDTLGAGIRMVRYGCLEEPYPTKILLKTLSQLQIVFIVRPDGVGAGVAAPLPFSIYTRVNGLIYVKQEGGV
jgi:hypothetical protein